MTWSEYVARLTGSMSKVDAGKRVGTTGQTIGRWLDGASPSVEQALAFARAFGDSPLNALVALGHITPQEARQRPTPAPDYSRLTNGALVDLVRSRLEATAVTTEWDAELDEITAGLTPEAAAKLRLHAKLRRLAEKAEPVARERILHLLDDLSA